MFPSVTPIRMVRLCLKELRESLRDRRTIVTLVLMPLLVYPLLSLILNRVLLTSLSNNSEVELTIGIGVDLVDSQLPVALAFGYGLIKERDVTPIFIEEPVQDRRPKQRDDEPFKRKPPRLLNLQDDGREALRNGSVDVVITRKSNEANGWRKETEEGKATLELLTKSLGGSQLEELDVERMLDTIGKYEVRYRAGEPNSERTLQILERIFAAFNDQASRELIGPGYRTPIRLSATPVVMKSSYADLLATMVPLVLVLMTMAGAVYPAIDLTAGERERGTMEALIVSPTPSAILLLAKYSAVVTVALLTALANLAAMTLTLWVSGIGVLIFGEDVLSTGVIGVVLTLLVLFTMFFAALLLAITSFAKSFKEAQAYLIPLMLLALTPGVMSLLPGIKFTPLLATVPLVNIVLLARQVLVGSAEWNTALVAVICNGIYAIAALSVASRLFGSDASMQGSQGSWRDLLMRPFESKSYPSLDQMALTMAVMFPLYFVASSLLSSVSESMEVRLQMSAVVSFLLILGVPLLVAVYRRIDLFKTFRLGCGAPLRWMLWLPAVLLVAGSAWMMAHEIFVAAQAIGIGTISDEKFAELSEFRDDLNRLPLALVLFVFAITPAVCEEFLFRGFVLSSLHKYSTFWAVTISALLFGLMHVLTSNVLAVERFLPTTFMGILLGFIALRTGSIWPGMILHALHNGLLLCMGYFNEDLKQWGVLVEEEQHLPTQWLVGGCLALAIGLALIWVSTRPKRNAAVLLSAPAA